MRRGGRAARAVALRTEFAADLGRERASASIYSSRLSIVKPWKPSLPRTVGGPASFCAAKTSDDVRPDAPLPAPAGRRGPACAVVDLLDLLALTRDPHRLRLACLAAEKSRPAGLTKDPGPHCFLTSGSPASFNPQHTESARWRERFQPYGGGLRTPFGGPRRPARRRFQGLMRGYFAACAAFFLGTGSPASPATCPLTTA
jgi:hypothetical protein